MRQPYIRYGQRRLYAGFIALCNGDTLVALDNFPCRKTSTTKDRKQRKQVTSANDPRNFSSKLYCKLGGGEHYCKIFTGDSMCINFPGDFPYFCLFSELSVLDHSLKKGLSHKDSE